jgi:hypothetical protein
LVAEAGGADDAAALHCHVDRLIVAGNRNDVARGSRRFREHDRRHEVDGHVVAVLFHMIRRLGVGFEHDAAEPGMAGGADDGWAILRRPGRA